jgi:DNA-binding winged helix-turn-helix (wHTH) protein/predicted negative regulator of RcsB-dependent stress response
MLVFGAFELDDASFQLRREGEVVNVEPQVLDVITYLARHRDRMVRKEELLDEVWGDRFVSESALTSRIKSARQALGDDGRTQSMIRTVHGRGYQFVPMVTDADALPPEASAAPDEDTAATAVTDGDDDALAAARAEFDRAQWAEARRRFAAIGVSALGSADLERWGDAAWWASDLVEAISVRQEAFRRYCAEGDDCAAGRVAIALSDDYLHRGSSTVALAWLDRARDLLAGSPGCRETGLLLRTQSNYELELHADPAAALATNARLREFAAEIGDADLIALSQQDHGRILLAKGEVDDGMAIIDRSMLAAATTETTASIRGRMYCNMLSACVGLGHYKRAMDWTDEALTWCATQSDSPFPGVCEVHRAGLRRRLGELEAALADLEPLATRSQLANIAGPALLEIGETQLARGDVDAAEEAFQQAHAYGADATAGFATVAMARGQADDAVALLVDALAARPDDHVTRRQLLPHLVDAAAIAGDVETARRAADDFDALSRTGSDVCRACAARAEGTVALVEGRSLEARDSFQRSVSLYRAAQLQLDLATAQFGLAAAWNDLGSEAAAKVERAAAMSTLDALGAVPSATAQLWLGRLGRSDVTQPND